MTHSCSQNKPLAKWETFRGRTRPNILIMLKSVKILILRDIATLSVWQLVPVNCRLYHTHIQTTTHRRPVRGWLSTWHSYSHNLRHVDIHTVLIHIHPHCDMSITLSGTSGQLSWRSSTVWMMIGLSNNPQHEGCCTAYSTRCNLAYHYDCLMTGVNIWEQACNVGWWSTRPAKTSSITGCCYCNVMLPTGLLVLLIAAWNGCTKLSPEKWTFGDA